MTDDSAFDTLTRFVETELGFATSHYNDSYLDRRLSSRMRRTDSDDYNEYFSLLRDNDTEQEALLDALSINVTGFFRNPDVWAGIRDVLRDLSNSKDAVHVWSAACADGREPYSVAMLAHDDAQIDEDVVHISATDISKPALEVARAGVYEESRTVDLASQLEFLGDYERYVDVTDDQYAVVDGLKRSITFDRHDLINDEPPAGFDLVICRNLFIYIDTEYKQAVLEKISDALVDEGYLAIGKAETIPPDLKSAFDVYDGRLRIYRHAD